ncbi:MAG: chemotaxis protein CheW [Planctomycetia bacterium]
MLALQFSVGDGRYLLPVEQVVAVVPWVHLKPMLHAPVQFAGIMMYRDRAVPVVDLGILLGEAPCPPRLSSRIVLVENDGAEQRLVGLLAERVTDTVDVDPGDLRDLGVALPDAPFLGSVTSIDDVLLQWIDRDLLVEAALVAPILAAPRPALRSLGRLVDPSDAVEAVER